MVFWAGILVVIGACAVSAPPALASGPASTFTVSGFADGTGPCTAPDSNGNSVCPTLRAAVVQASTQANRPTIELQAGTYSLDNPSGQLDLASSMNIVGAGPGGAGTTIAQRDGRSRVLEVQGATTLTGLEITGGHYTPPWGSGQVAYGGGILVLGVLTLNDGLVTGNQGIGAAGVSGGDTGDDAVGGGLAYGSTAGAGSTITDSTITGNAAVGGAGGIGSPGGTAQGGGIAYEGPGPLIALGSTIDHNTATGGGGGPQASGGAAGGAAEGGGIFNTSGLTLKASTLTANAATGGAEGTGGASPPPSSTGGAGQGGGIFSQNSNDQLVNSTVFSNSAAGGAPATGGTAGQGSGGGVVAWGSSATTLQNDTIDANTADAAGNLELGVGAGATVHDTIIARGAPNNCSIAAASSFSESYNLEDDLANGCGFRTFNHDLLATDPQLPTSLGNNGGPTQTLAPATTSPVLRAGGACTDPTSAPPNQPLGSDQRGLPRTAPCDIGAFQAQAPAVTALPGVFGKVARGQTLICTEGTWTGDGPLSIAFGWLRNGVPIPGVNTNTYVVGPADGGKSLACRVTASHYGSVAANSPFVIVPSYPVITILKVSGGASGVVISFGCRGPDLQRCRGRFKLTVVERLRGRKVVGLVAGAGKPHTVTLGQRSYSILARHTSTLLVGFNRTAARLLAEFKHLPVLLTVTQTTAAGTETLASRRLKISRPRTSAHHPR